MTAEREVCDALRSIARELKEIRQLLQSGVEVITQNNQLLSDLYAQEAALEEEFAELREQVQKTEEGKE